MRKFEYKAIPSPSSGTKAKGVKSTEDRFALSITEVLNDMAAEGWEYVRAETLPCDERKGLTGTQTSYQNLLIFKRFQSAAEPIALKPERIVSAPAPIAEHVEATPRPISEPIQPRRVSTQPAEGNAPRLGAATQED